MSNDVWFGALLSIPIGIVTGVAVIPIQKWTENRGKSKALVQAQEAKEQYNSVLFFRLHPLLFSQYLLHVVIRTTFIGATVGIISGIIYALAEFGDRSFIFFDLREVLNVAGQLTAIVSSVLIISYCRPALNKMVSSKKFFRVCQNSAWRDSRPCIGGSSRVRGKRELTGCIRR